MFGLYTLKINYSPLEFSRLVMYSSKVNFARILRLLLTGIVYQLTFNYVPGAYWI